jgi:hypothetical protein
VTGIGDIFAMSDNDLVFAADALPAAVTFSVTTNESKVVAVLKL